MRSITLFILHLASQPLSHWHNNKMYWSKEDGSWNGSTTPTSMGLATNSPMAHMALTSTTLPSFPWAQMNNRWSTLNISTPTHKRERSSRRLLLPPVTLSMLFRKNTSSWSTLRNSLQSFQEVHRFVCLEREVVSFFGSVSSHSFFFFSLSSLLKLKTNWSTYKSGCAQTEPYFLDWVTMLYR